MKRIAFALGLFVLIGCNGRPSSDAETARPNARPTALEMPIPEPDSVSRRIFEQTMAFARAEDLRGRPIGEVMTAIGERFLKAPYEAGMLDVPDEETLICRLDAFDCVTFVETTLAMARAIKNGQYDYDTWARNVQDERYRNGQIQGYCSRLHYFSEWIIDNEERGNVENITREIGGVPLEKSFDFMTTHRESYPRMAENDSLFQCIRDMEERMRSAELFYVPQDRIRAVYDQLQAGDIVALATRIEGLDVTHTGLVYDNGDGTMGLLHASTSGGVKVSPDLQGYVQGIDHQIGIIVARPLDQARS